MMNQQSTHLPFEISIEIIERYELDKYGEMLRVSTADDARFLQLMLRVSTADGFEVCLYIWKDLLLRSTLHFLYKVARFRKLIRLSRC